MSNDNNDNDFQPADPSLIQIAVERIVSLRKNDLVSENPANRATFEVDSATAGRSSVEIYVIGKTAPAHVLNIGKGGPAWNTNYVRLAGSDAVYLVPGDLRQSLFLGLEQWRKKPEPEPENTGAEDDGEGDDKNK